MFECLDEVVGYHSQLVPFVLAKVPSTDGGSRVGVGPQRVKLSSTAASRVPINLHHTTGKIELIVWSVSIEGKTNGTSSPVFSGV
jgi:hypothetical protein